MNIIPAYLKKTGRTLLAAALCCCVLASCDSVIYDGEGDCSVTYRVAFRYDRNMKWADAFAHEVKSVHLYAFDKNGTLVWQNAEKGEALAADNDYEKMHSLRIIVTDADGNVVEHNKHISFKSALTTEYIYECSTLPGKKKIYLIANEESVQYDDNTDSTTPDGSTPGTTTTKSLHELLDGITVGTTNFGELINGIVFEPDYTQETGIPMSSEYDIEVGEGTKTDAGTLYVVRVATKFTINIENYREKEIVVSDFTIESVADRNYLMPHLNTSNPLFNGYDTWIDWLKKVSEDSQIDPNNPTADDAGWLQEYDLPDDAKKDNTYQYNSRTATDKKITISAGTTDDSPGKSTVTGIYIPESMNLKAGESQYGEQEYKMSFTVDGKKTESKPLPNLKALFRNTHVLVTVRFGKGVEVIYGGIVYWGFYDSVTGIVEEEKENE